MRISDWSSDVCSSDLPTELNPFLVVFQRGFQAPPRQTYGACRGMRPCDLKATRCQIEGTTRLAYHVGVRNPALVEGKFPGLPAKISDFRDRCTGTIVGQAAARLFDEECRNAFVRLRRVHGLGPRQYENGIGAVGVGAPIFVACDQPILPVTLGAGGEARNVRDRKSTRLNSSH